jgi:hypothetical protein
VYSCTVGLNIIAPRQSVFDPKSQDNMAFERLQILLLVVFFCTILLLARESVVDLLSMSSST